MKTCAIIPVKTFSEAKTRLNLSKTQKEEICKAMLEEVLGTVSKSQLINKIILVSKDSNDEYFNSIEKNNSIYNSHLPTTDSYVSKILDTLNETKIFRCLYVFSNLWLLKFLNQYSYDKLYFLNVPLIK